MKTVPFIVLIDGKPVGTYEMPIPTQPLYQMSGQYKFTDKGREKQFNQFWGNLESKIAND